MNKRMALPQMTLNTALCHCPMQNASILIYAAIIKMLQFLLEKHTEKLTLACAHAE